MNQCQLMGRLTRDPELRTTTTGVPVTTFSIAVDRRKGKDGTQETDFFTIVAWRHTAEFVARYFAKGQRVAVTGQIQNREYQDKEGVNRRATEIVAESVYFADSKREDGGGYGQNYAPPPTHQAPPPQQPQQQAPSHQPPPAQPQGEGHAPVQETAQFTPLTSADDEDLPF